MPASRPRALRSLPEPYSTEVKHERTRSPSPLPEPLPTLASALDTKPGLTPPKKGRKKAPKVKAEPTDADKGKGSYDRALLVALVAKASKADYATLADNVGKTPTQCRDIWRKVVFPALTEGREWSAGVRGWDGAMKLHLAREVLGTAKPDWEAVASNFPGRTTSQVSDIWRKVVLPRLMGGKPLY